MIEQTKHQCPSCGNYDNVTVLELILSCNMCEDKSVLWNREIGEFIEMIELSNCCKRQIIVDSSDEGTSCFVCGKCKKSCDLLKPNLDFLKLKVLIPNHSAIDFDKWLDINNKELIDKSEYERLKRLGENVNKIKEQIKSGKMFNIPIELLESLDK